METGNKSWMCSRWCACASAVVIVDRSLEVPLPVEGWRYNYRHVRQKFFLQILFVTDWLTAPATVRLFADCGCFVFRSYLRTRTIGIGVWGSGGKEKKIKIESIFSFRCLLDRLLQLLVSREMIIYCCCCRSMKFGLLVSQMWPAYWNGMPPATTVLLIIDYSGGVILLKP